MPHRERHRSERIGWLRAAVLGADDGIVSTASLVVGVAVAGSPRHEILLAGADGATFARDAGSTGNRDRFVFSAWTLRFAAGDLLGISEVCSRI
jgi:hypothetical protein